MSEPKGQILRGSPFGEALFKLCKRPEFMNVVEIGTWRGQGSTKCIMDALLIRNDKSALWSLETKPEFYKEARSYWDMTLTIYPMARVHGKLNLIHGRIVEPDELVSVEEIMAHPRFKDHPWLEWRERNIEEYGSCPNVLDQLPDRIDVFLQDGGQFSARAEWQKIESRVQVVLLDDTTTYKGDTVRQQIIEEPNWIVIVDDLIDRNGYFIACRVENEQIVRDSLSSDFKI